VANPKRCIGPAGTPPNEAMEPPAPLSSRTRLVAETLGVTGEIDERKSRIPGNSCLGTP
jgi:hypothetical protein